MAQLASFQLLSSASCLGAKWQQQKLLLSSSALVSLKVTTALPLRLHTTVIRCQVGELSPKELHHLRKKEAQKKIRKVRKERKAKRRAEEVARIPKPNPALEKFERPLVNWNKPWKRRKGSAYVRQQSGEPHQGLGFKDRGKSVFRRESSFESAASPIKEATFDPSWSEFEAVYEEKVSTPAYRLAHGKIFSNSGNKKGEFKAEDDRMLAKSSDRRGELRSVYRSNSKGKSRGETNKGNPTGNGVSTLPRKENFVSTKTENRGPLSQHSLSNSLSERGAGGSNGGQDDRTVVRGVSSRGVEELNARADSQVIDVEDPASKVSRGEDFSPLSFPSSGEEKTFTKKLDHIQDQGDRVAWRRSTGNADRTQKWSAESKAVVQHVDLTRASNAGWDEGGNTEETRQPFRIRTRSGGGVGSSTTSTSSDVGKDAKLNRRGAGGPRSVEQGVETSEFWDRRNTHRDEPFDGELLRKKFESSDESKRYTSKERLKESKAFDREVARIVIGRRKGENVYLSTADDDAMAVRGLPRSDLDEDKQLEWLAKQLHTSGRPDGVHLSRLMRSGGLKITDGRAVTLVQRLGELGNWRCALQVVEWLNSRNQFPPVRSRYLFTTLLDVLGKARRPIESLNVFNVMREHVATYPDMPAYRVIAVTLGQAGSMEELFELMQSLRQGPERGTKYLLMLEDQGRLVPDIVVYNAALNSCVPHKHWRCALQILDELESAKNLWPNSASYGLAIEVMVKAGKFDLAWKTLEKMELGGFHPNSLTYKALVEGLGQVGKADLAIDMVKQMEERGMVPVSGVYYALASTLCMSGRWQDALLQVDRIVNLSKRPMVETYTGLIKACKEAGHWRDAISVFDRMREVCAPNIGTYNMMISLYGAHKMHGEAKELFQQIKTGRASPRKLYRDDIQLSPDMYTYDAMLGCYTISEQWEDLEVLFRQMLLQGYQLDCKRHTWIVRAISDGGKDDLVMAMCNHLRSLNAATSELYVLMIRSCLRGGEQDKAFSHLEEMVHQDMRISSSDLQKFKEVASLISEDDRLSFLSKVEGLKVTSNFNFKQPGVLSSLHQRSPALKPPNSLKALSSVLHGRGERTDSNSKTSTRRFSLAGSHKRFVGTGLSAGEAKPGGRNGLPPKGLAQIEKQQIARRDQQSTRKLSDFPGWELLWKHSSHVRQLSSNFRLSQQLT